MQNTAARENSEYTFEDVSVRAHALELAYRQHDDADVGGHFGGSVFLE